MKEAESNTNYTIEDKMNLLQKLLNINRAVAAAWLAIAEHGHPEKLENKYGKKIAQTVLDVHSGEAFSPLWGSK